MAILIHVKHICWWMYKGCGSNCTLDMILNLQDVFSINVERTDGEVAHPPLVAASNLASDISESNHISSDDHILDVTTVVRWLNKKIVTRWIKAPHFAHVFFRWLSNILEGGGVPELRPLGQGKIESSKWPLLIHENLWNFNQIQYNHDWVVVLCASIPVWLQCHH